MKNTIENFVKEIKEKTDISVSVFYPNGKFLCGEPSEDLKTETTSLISELDGDTVFTVNSPSEYVFKIKGTGEEIKKYALLIFELIKNYSFKAKKTTKEEFLRSVLENKITYAEIKKGIKDFGIVDSYCLAFAIKPKKADETDEFLSFVSEYTNNDSDYALKVEDAIALIKFVSENEEYRSPYEYANFLRQSFYEETGGRVEIFIGGIVKSVSDLNTSFYEAVEAMRVFEVTGGNGDVHSFREYFPYKMFSEMPKSKLNEYFSALLDERGKEIFSDEEMITTAEEFLENNLNISETSRKLYLHRNTLSYKLDKIERATGLDIRKFSDAVTFKIITVLDKLLK